MTAGEGRAATEEGLTGEFKLVGEGKGRVRGGGKVKDVSAERGGGAETESEGGGAVTSDNVRIEGDDKRFRRDMGRIDMGVRGGGNRKEEEEEVVPRGKVARAAERSRIDEEEAGGRGVLGRAAAEARRGECMVKRDRGLGVVEEAEAETTRGTGTDEEEGSGIVVELKLGKIEGGESERETAAT